MIIELDNISLSFETKTILHGVYLKAESSRITGILGANGTGKSSLLRILFGNLQPQQKLLKIDSRPFLKPLFTSGMVKFLPQQNLIPPDINLQKAIKLYNLSWNGLTTCFPAFDKYAKARVSELSGGERRILEIYLSLKSRASIVLLDEPFSHLSPVNIEKIKQLILDNRQEKAVILTDHLYRHVIDLANDLYLINNGCTKLIRDLKELESYHYLNPNSL